VVLAKFAADGTLLFAGNLGGTSDDLAADIVVGANGDAIVVGTTYSDDFAGAPRPVPGQGWRADAFVAQVRGDGSGVVWARRFGGDEDQHFQGCGVALDAADGTILVGIAGSLSGARAPFAGELYPPKGVKSPRLYDSELTCEVIRLTGAGEQLQGARLRFLGPQAGGSRFGAPVALARDGAVLVGGVLGVARITRELFLGVEDVWVHRQRWTVAERLCVDPAGRVIVAERPFGYEDGYVITVRGPALADGETSVDRAAELGFRPADIAVDADGSLLVVGNGDAASFHAPYAEPGPATGCIARVPLDGVRAPARLRARVVSTRDVDLTWSRDGDPASGFDIESIGPDWVAHAAPRLLAHVGGDVFRFRTPGLTPGSYEGIRVVAVFASGVRSASPVRFVSMPPVAATGVVARDEVGQAVDVQWESANGGLTSWELQRRFGDGPWMATTATGYAVQETRLIDVVPDVTVPVRYRVRAQWGNRHSAWTESSAVLPASSLRVGATDGHFDPQSPHGYVFVAAGTFARRTDGARVPFDPATQDLDIVYGYAVQPDRLTLPHGDAGWTSADGVATWRAQDAATGFEPGSDVVLDLAHGTFRIRLNASYWGSYVPDRSVAVNLAFGEYSGGDVRVWRRVAGTTLRLDGSPAR
jgi:hypothetical protein